MAAKKGKKPTKKVKALPAKRMTAGQAKGVKGGTIGRWKLDTWRP